MIRFTRPLLLFAFSILLFSMGNSAPVAQADRESAVKLMKDGNYLQAYNLFIKRVLDPGADPALVDKDFTEAVVCLHRLNRVDELDAFREKAVLLHKRNWRLLQAAAKSLYNGPFEGFMVEGKFQRGSSRGGGQYVSSYARDRALALRWLVEGIPFAEKDPDHAAVGQYFRQLAEGLFRDHGQSWRLQYLTDLTELPDYGEEDYGGGRRAPAHRYPWSAAMATCGWVSRSTRRWEPRPAAP